LLTDLSRVALGESADHPFATFKYPIFGHRR
jgi:hypothetical protein